MKVLVDVDGIVADFASVYYQAVQTELSKEYEGDIHQRKTWDVGDALSLTDAEKALVHVPLVQPGVAANIPPIQEGIAAVREISQFADIVFVTAQFMESPTWIFDRALWLEKYFGNIDYHVVHTWSKELVWGGVLIDDKPINLDRWEHAMRRIGINPLPVLFAWAYNEGQTPTGGVRTNDWETIKLLLKDRLSR